MDDFAILFKNCLYHVNIALTKYISLYDMKDNNLN